MIDPSTRRPQGPAVQGDERSLDAVGSAVIVVAPAGDGVVVPNPAGVEGLGADSDESACGWVSPAADVPAPASRSVLSVRSPQVYAPLELTAVNCPSGGSVWP